MRSQFSFVYVLSVVIKIVSREKQEPKLRSILLTGRTPEQDQAHMGEASCLRSVEGYGAIDAHHYIQRETERERERGRCTIYRKKIRRGAVN